VRRIISAIRGHTWTCSNCGANNVSGDNTCNICGKW